MEPGFIINLLLAYKYALMAPAAFLLGPTVSLLSGFLLRLGYVELVPTWLALAAGELLGDVLWYWLGRRYGDSFVAKFGRYVGITEHTLGSVKRMFNRYHDAIIFFSKLTAGFGLAPAIFFTAGLSRVSFRRYMALNVAGQILWTSGLLAAGFFAGNIFASVDSVFGKIFSAIVVVLVLLALFGFGTYLKKRAESSD